MEKRKMNKKNGDRMKSKILTSLMIALMILSAFSAISINVRVANAYNKDNHDIIIDEALRLLWQDQQSFVYSVFSDPKMRQALKEGSNDADHGSWWNGRKYARDWNGGEWSKDYPFLEQMDGWGPDGEWNAVGGLSHMFDPWSHEGTGFTEDPERMKHKIESELNTWTGWLGERLGIDRAEQGRWALEYGQDIMAEYVPLQGKNAAECAVKNYNRAVKAWKMSIQEDSPDAAQADRLQAAYWLGYVLHVIADETIPYHSANELEKGHQQYEDFVEHDMKGDYGCQDLYKIDANDHVISFHDFGPLTTWNDGNVEYPLIAGGNLSLNEGHVTQTAYNDYRPPVYWFVDFAGHESIQWYLLANDRGSTARPTVRFTDWWTLDSTHWYWEGGHWIKSGTMYSTGDTRQSSIVMHFEPWARALPGGYEAGPFRTGNIWASISCAGLQLLVSGDLWYHPPDAIGSIEAWENYFAENQHDQMGFTHALTFSERPPDVFDTMGEGDTLEIRTVIDPGDVGKQCYFTVTGVQVSDQYGPNDVLPQDPLTMPIYKLQKDRTTDTFSLPLLDTPIETKIAFRNLGLGSDILTARRVAAVHMTNLAIKLDAGMLKQFYDDCIASEDKDTPVGFLTILGDRLSYPQDARAREFTKTPYVTIHYTWHDHGPVRIRFLLPGEDDWSPYKLVDESKTHTDGGGEIPWDLPGPAGVKWFYYEIEDATHHVGICTSIRFTDAQPTNIFFNLNPNPASNPDLTNTDTGTLPIRTDNAVKLSGILVDDAGSPVQTLPTAHARDLRSLIRISYCLVNPLTGFCYIDTEAPLATDVVTDANGRFSINLPVLAPGLYMFQAHYYSDWYHYDSNNTALFYQGAPENVYSEPIHEEPRLLFDTRSINAFTFGRVTQLRGIVPGQVQNPQVNVALSAYTKDLHWIEAGTPTTDEHGFFLLNMMNLENQLNLENVEIGQGWLMNVSYSNTFVVTYNARFSEAGNITTITDPNKVTLSLPWNLMSEKNQWFSVPLELPGGQYHIKNIEWTSLRLNDTIAVEPDRICSMDYDNDGVDEVILGFNKTAVSNFAMSQGAVAGNVTFTLTGELFTGEWFAVDIMTQVKMPGDINIDGKVDLNDLALVARAYGTSPGDSKWNAFADENENGKIDLCDLVDICMNYGKKYP
jgi:hypothetical protein